jgi:hypothetical protein
MNVMRRRLSLAACGALAAASIALLAGCTGPSTPKVGSVSTDSPAVAVPASFPKAVPLYSGKVVDARGLGSGNSQIWTVTVALPNAGAIDSIALSLTSAGFKAMKEKSSSGNGSTIVADDKSYSVLVVEAKNTSGWFANYTVTAAKS